MLSFSSILLWLVIILIKNDNNNDKIKQTIILAKCDVFGEMSTAKHLCHWKKYHEASSDFLGLNIVEFDGILHDKCGYRKPCTLTHLHWKLPNPIFFDIFVDFFNLFLNLLHSFDVRVAYDASHGNYF